MRSLLLLLCAVIVPCTGRTIPAGESRMLHVVCGMDTTTTYSVRRDDVLIFSHQWNRNGMITFQAQDPGFFKVIPDSIP